MNLAKSENNSALIERMSFHYPPELTGDELDKVEARKQIDTARSLVSDSMILAYSSLMHKLPPEAEQEVKQYVRVRRDFDPAFPDYLNEYYLSKSLSKLGRKTNLPSLEDIFDGATYLQCFGASVMTIMELSERNSVGFTKLFVVRAEYPKESITEWPFHTYFVAELPLKLPTSEISSWYFSGSPANASHYEDPLRIFESPTLDELMRIINSADENIFPSGNDIKDAFKKVPYSAPVFQPVEDLEGFMRPKFCDVDKTQDKGVHVLTINSNALLYRGKRSYIGDLSS